MKYRDLIQFDPISSVIQVGEANDRARAKELVATYVISNRMADVILRQILPVLDLNPSPRSGGLFIVGNYGTGKSHLMSAISALAEHEELGEGITHPAVAEGLEPILGKFKVIRQEFGGTKMSLRDVIMGYLEVGLADLGVTFQFPPMTEAPNSKDLLVAMMARYHDSYPNHGLFVVIDELLEFLTSSQDRQLIQDLAFLRELGEICSRTKLRFVAGLQEALFDNPRFQFVADSVRRVKDRFEQVRIVREDVAYVVSRRLLNKNDKQRAWIRHHLEQFTGLYGEMAERLDEYVALFPVHPAYLETFEQVTIIEKRQALREISQEIQQWLDQDVPTDEPGILSFDSYWRAIQSDASYRAEPEIRLVLDKSKVIEEKIQSAVRPAYRSAALRIIHALALHRLTVGDINAPIGLSAQELRDRLCLILVIPERDADFLLTSVESVLDEVIRAVSGQFISRNKENGQYYLDLDKDVDFDALVEQRADTLGDDTLDRYYFDMLAHALELTDSVYVPGFRIWQREIPWPGHGITRDGYIFLGAPTQRSTAQPERDFYVHFLGLFDRGEETSSPHEDEIFYTLKQWDDVFDRALRLFAGAREMSTISSGSNRSQYDKKAESYRQRLVNWLRENLVRAFTIQCQNRTYTVSDLMARQRLSLQNLTLRDQIFQLSAALLMPVFESRYPDYPQFSGINMTTTTVPQVANAGLRAIAGGAMSRQAQVGLEGLQLIRHESGAWRFVPEESPYVRPLLQRLESLPPGQVMNRGELLTGDHRRERSVDFNLEPEWLALMLLTLVRQGVITLQLRGRKIGVDDLDEAAQLGSEELLRFTSIAKPKALPEQALRALFAGLDLPEGLVRDAAQHDLAVQSLANRVVQELDRAVQALERLRTGLTFWRFDVLSEAEGSQWREEIDRFRDLLQTVERIRTPGHLRNFSVAEPQVKRAIKGRRTLLEFERLQRMLESLHPQLEVIYQAETALPGDDPWQGELQQVRAEQQKRLQDATQRQQPATIALVKGALGNLHSAYVQAYLDMHNWSRLNTSQDARKQRLTRDPRHAQLRALSELDLLPLSELERWEGGVQSLMTCMGCAPSELNQRAICPHCGYHPRSAGKEEQSALARLESHEKAFDDLFARWVETLQQELDKETARQNLALLPDAQRQAVQAFVASGSLPEKLTRPLVEGMQDALAGLEKVNIDGTDLLVALTRPGMPCTLQDLESRFRTLLQAKTQGKFPAKVRIQIDW